MMDDCPEYYQMSQYEDLNTWVARKLLAAQWRDHEQAIYLDITWYNMLNYAIRLPFKAKNAKQLVEDIDKAIKSFRDIRAVFVPPAEPESVQAPQATTSAHRPLCPNQCGNRLMPTPPHDKDRGDWRCMDCPALEGTGKLNAYFWQTDLETPPPPASTFPFNQLHQYEQDTIRACAGKHGPWYRWETPAWVKVVSTTYLKDHGMPTQGTLTRIAIPEEDGESVPTCPQCGGQLRIASDSPERTWICDSCAANTSVKRWLYAQQELDAAQRQPPPPPAPACPQCREPLIRVPTNYDVLGDWTCYNETDHAKRFFWQSELDPTAHEAEVTCPHCGTSRGCLRRTSADTGEVDWICMQQVPWTALTETQRDHIRMCHRPGMQWLHWRKPNGDTEVVRAEDEATYALARRRGTVRPVALPEEVANGPTTD